MESKIYYHLDAFKMLNKEQQIAFHKIANIGKNGRLFITASPGRGKTKVLVDVIREIFLKKDFLCLAPSHKAKDNIIAEFEPGDGEDDSAFKIVSSNVITTAQALGYKHVDPEFDEYGNILNPDTAYTFIRDEKASKMHLANIVFIDEVGMVNESDLELILEHDVPVIMFGDIYQLKPVKSKQYDFSKVEVFELVENMRQNLKDSLLVREIEAYKYAIKNKTISVRNIEPDGETIVDSRDLVEDYVNNKIEIIGCFTNKYVDAYNNAIQSRLYGSNVPQKGQILLLSAPIRKTRSNKNGEVIQVPYKQNGSKVYVMDTRPSIYIDGMYDVKLFNNESDVRTAPDEGWFIFVDRKYKESWYDELYLPNKKNAPYGYKWYKAFKRKLMFAQYTHSVTVHKMQGSTYGRIGLNKFDIDTCFDADTRNRLMYVGLSRAVDKVYLRL